MRSSRNTDSLLVLGPSDLSMKSGPEPRQMAVAFDPPQSRFDDQQRAGDPALFLVRRAPPVDLVGDLAELGIERFQTVRGLQTDAQGLKEAQPMQRERVLEPFIQTGCCRGVEPPQLFAQGQERPLRLLIGGL